LQSSAEGLSSTLAQQHLETFGHNLLRDREKATPFRLFLNQFKSPLVLILVFAAATR
jgi:Mg2+-importing ATPase